MTDIPCKTCDKPMRGIKDAAIREKCNDCMEIDGIIIRALEEYSEDK